MYNGFVLGVIAIFDHIDESNVDWYLEEGRGGANHGYSRNDGMFEGLPAESKAPIVIVLKSSNRLCHKLWHRRYCMILNSHLYTVV